MPSAGELVEGQSVVVEGGRIADIGPGLSGPDDAALIDVAGKTVMPGLIDAHTHPTSVSLDFAFVGVAADLRGGDRGTGPARNAFAREFTTIRDAGGGDHGLARAVDEGISLARGSSTAANS